MSEKLCKLIPFPSKNPSGNKCDRGAERTMPFKREELIADKSAEDSRKIKSCREEIRKYTIRIMEGSTMLAFNPSFESFENAKLNAEESFGPEDEIDTTIAAIGVPEKKLYIVSGTREKLMKDALFAERYGDFEVEYIDSNKAKNKI
ncbi:hypothetical protein KKD70_05215 [Patescibacteria group bacterium]|nr:hypothetical protein [Patescibacteria group bacterium]